MNNLPPPDAIFGTRGAPPAIETDTGRVTAKPVLINLITPDLRQPRRVIPAVVRAQWDGDPIEMPTLLSNWHLLVEERLGITIDLSKVLRGEGDGIDDIKTDDPALASYFEVIHLAASIYRDGLVNPIRVVKRRGGYLLESGERRWVAYQMLHLHVSGDFASIPAIERLRLDVWAQAAENGARSPLNAIGMARQLALLIMAMYEHDDGVSFDSYGKLVLPGECDRKYYAQVANGNIFRIKKGMGERVLSVTGLKSLKQLSQYRALLDIPDALWLKADEQNWSENAIREYVSASKPSEEITDTSTVVEVSDGDEIINPSVSLQSPSAVDTDINPSVSPDQAAYFAPLEVGERVRTTNGQIGTIDAIIGNSAHLKGLGNRHLNKLVRVDPLTPLTTPGSFRGTEVEVEEKTHSSSPVLGSADWLLKQFPLGSFVYHPELDAVGVVRRVELVSERLLIADVSLPDSQQLQLWDVANIRAATPAEVEAHTVHHPPSRGLYDRPAGRQPIAPFAKPVTVSGGAALDEDVEEDAPEPVHANNESTTALLDEWANEQLAPTLRFLKRLAHNINYPVTETDLADVMTVSRSDIANFLSLTPRNPNAWQEYLDDKAVHIAELANIVAQELTDYLNWLNEVGKEMALKGKK